MWRWIGFVLLGCAGAILLASFLIRTPVEEQVAVPPQLTFNPAGGASPFSSVDADLLQQQIDTAREQTDASQQAQGEAASGGIIVDEALLARIEQALNAQAEQPAVPTTPVAYAPQPSNAAVISHLEIWAAIAATFGALSSFLFQWRADRRQLEFLRAELQLARAKSQDAGTETK